MEEISVLYAHIHEQNILCLKYFFIYNIFVSSTMSTFVLTRLTFYPFVLNPENKVYFFILNKKPNQATPLPGSQVCKDYNEFGV